MSDRIYSELRDEIVSLALPPQSPISEQTLTEQYGSSRTPVREALRRLADEKLVEIIPKSGTFVSRIPLSLVNEALVARRALERVTTEHASTAQSSQEVDKLFDIVSAQKQVVDAENATPFHRLDNDFHRQIAVIAGYHGIWDLIQQMKVHIDRFRLLTLPKPGRMDQVIAEHTDIAQAIANGDSATAQVEMDQHLNQLHLDFDEFPNLSPCYFIQDLRK